MKMIIRVCLGATVFALLNHIVNLSRLDHETPGNHGHKGFIGVAYSQTLARDPHIPASVDRLIRSRPEILGIKVIKKPGEGNGSNYVAKIQFKPLRTGFVSCPDHYPSYWVRDRAHCPSLRDNDSPARNWVNCHKVYYSPASVSCAELPQTPVAPATISQAICDFNSERCEQEPPGGPVLIRTLRDKTLPQVRPGTITAFKLPQARELPARPNPTLITPGATTPRRLPDRPELRLPQATPLPRIVLPKTRIAPASRLNMAFLQQRLNPLRRPINNPVGLNCENGDCRWGSGDTPVSLPTPPVVPIKHVPCEYAYISFYVNENSYCPKEQNGQRPAAGATLFVSWEDNGSSPPAYYYHYMDHDGIIWVTVQILGDSDDRYAMNDATDREKNAARVTAMLVNNRNIIKEDESTVILEDDRSWTPLCSGERFHSLPQPGRCSAVKIGDRLLATSAHCIRNASYCSTTSVVFNYYGESSPRSRRMIPTDSVYQCVSIVDLRRPGRIGERGADWAVFKVDRDINAPSATLSGANDVHASLVTTVIGHPMGLPAIVTRFGVVQATTTNYFITSSDTFVGNSGSAVFNAESIEKENPVVVGLLTGGRYDFTTSMEEGVECVHAKRCTSPECLGDDVIYTDELARVLAM